MKRTRKEQKKRVSGPTLDLSNHQEGEPPAKKLAILAPSEEETYDYTTSLRCFKCSPMGEHVESLDANVRSNLASS